MELFSFTSHTVSGGWNWFTPRTCLVLDQQSSFLPVCGNKLSVWTRSSVGRNEVAPFTWMGPSYFTPIEDLLPPLRPTTFQGYVMRRHMVSKIRDHQAVYVLYKCVCFIVVCRWFCVGHMFSHNTKVHFKNTLFSNFSLIALFPHLILFFISWQQMPTFFLRSKSWHSWRRTLNNKMWLSQMLEPTKTRKLHSWMVKPCLNWLCGGLLVCRVLWRKEESLVIKVQDQERGGLVSRDGTALDFRCSLE